MKWEFILALVLAITVILFPVAYVWYLNIAGIHGIIKKARERSATTEKIKSIIKPLRAA